MMIPTFFGITIVVFLIINTAPGGPIEQKLQALRFSGALGGGAGGGVNIRTEQAVTQEMVEALKRRYGFDKPVHIRYWIWMKNLARLDFGESFTYEEPVMDVIVSKFPVSIQFGLASFFLTYLVCIPLGLFMAVKEEQRFDFTAFVILNIMYSIPPFMLGILLIVFFCRGKLS